LHRYAKEDGDLESLERDLNEETGWKLVHGDVFRPPQHRMLLAACVGTGGQLCMLGLFVILLTIMGTFYEVGRFWQWYGHVACELVA
jgi:transmembrane 9 superfamily protein 3